MWALLQMGAVQAVVREVAPPLVVDFVAMQAPQPPPPAAPPTSSKTPSAPRPAPVIAAAPSVDPAPAAFVVPPPEPAAVPADAAAALEPPAAPAPPLAPPPAPPAPPRHLPASAIAYLVPPPIEVPLASRRLRESGTVVLRVLVGADGVVRRIGVHRSSGYPRLDEQAIAAMRKARFKPQTENGVAIEWEVLAAAQYDVQ